MRLDRELLYEGFAKEIMQSARVLRKRILLAEDQQAVRSAIRHLLEVDDHSVTEARDGKEAFECFRRDIFDLVITDYAMPEMVGSDLAMEIKRLLPSQPIIMITAYSVDLLSTENTVDAVLTKPFSFHTLRETIASFFPGG